MADAHFFNDEPFLDHEEGSDLLGHRQYAHHVISLLDRVRAQTETGVLALIGPWGSGKSSVLGKVARRLRDDAANDEGWLVAELNLNRSGIGGGSMRWLQPPVGAGIERSSWSRARG
ncbi:P-loop NTPase fold protein, partial [Streptomyces albidoflavus]